eukprot:Skav235328  [mRNA]  locus=scaffold520:603852:614712:+ [translate_table: standard]
MGAYTDGEPPRMDETTKALQAIAKAVTSKDEAASHDKGKLASIGKVEERLVYLVRGCDALTVVLGKATVGKELFHSLRATSTQGRPQLRLMQFPVNINNRIAYGLASMNLGGKDSKTVPEFCLSVADFPLTSEEEFDGWTGCVDMKLEKRPKPPMTLNAWYRNALREAWAVSCVYGSEHYSAFEQAATYLLKLGEDHAYMWPAHAIFGVWEELWARYIEELRDLDRELRRAMKEESPTFERIRFFVTAPGEDGTTVLSRACWQVALKRSPGGSLQGGKAGEEPEASDSRPGAKTGKAEVSPKGLLGPPLTNKEAARALDHRPKEKKGARYLCWDHLCHRGCAKPASCPHSHGTAPKWEHLDWAVQLQMLRRGGLRSGAKLTEAQVSEQMESIRRTQQAKNQEMVAEGKKMKKVGGEPHTEGQTAEAKVGECLMPTQATSQEEPPEEFTRIYPTDQEAEMVELLEGPDFSFFEDNDKGKLTREAQIEGYQLSKDVEDRQRLMGEVDKSHLVTGLGEQLETYVKNQLLLLKEEDPSRTLQAEDVRRVLETARAKGCGYWDVVDFGDKLYPSGQWTKDLLNKDPEDRGPEARQCLLLHCAAGHLQKKHGKVPTWTEVQAQANDMRQELIEQASEASRHLGDCPETMPRSEADLRVFVHDLLHWSHDKDYRTLASFPPSNLLDSTLNVVRMASDGDLSTEVIMGALSSGQACQQIHLLVHQGHMRLLVPTQLERKPPVIRDVIAAGWECHLEAAHGSEASVRARDYLLCPRCSTPEEVPRRAGVRPPSVLGLHLQSDASERIGAWAPGALEVKDLPPTQWSDEELAIWLGPQADVFRRALSHGLDFLEVYAGKARASQAVLAKGGTALFLGLDHGQDFRRAKDRSLGRALVQRLKPKHLWGAFPCTPFCAWIRLAMLRNCDMTPRLQEGRVHLKFILELCSLQVAGKREAHLENPLTSMAWKEPMALDALAAPCWLRARLDQCQTGLSSPEGGLHLKPTLIRTTDAQMQQTLSLKCPRLHDHDPVEGQATALSAMYSPHMADLIATVVMSSRSGGGGGASFSLSSTSGPTARVGGTEASFSPGNPAPWYEGLKGPELKGPLQPPLKDDLEKACKEYLEFVTSTPYDKDAFKKGAELGSRVLQAAGGWEEANRGIRRTWVASQGDHFEGLHSDFFEGLVSPNLLSKARENAIWGISARYEGGVGERVQCGPHPSLKEHLEEAAQQLWKDASRGRVLLCFDEGGEELKGVVSVAMARVPKMLPNRTISSKGRVIWDAKPINEFCDKTRHPPALQPKHDEIARLIVWWQTRYPGTPILVSKKDVSDAFKWIPVRGEDTRLFAADLPGGEFGAPGKNITVLYNSLTFGWTVSRVVMDDAVLIEPKIGIRPWISVHTMEECTRKALGDGAINAAKDEVEGALDTRKLIWGLMYDTERNTRALPPQKLEKASYLLHLPEFDHGNTRIPLKLIQELRGNQQFWISVLPSLKPLLSATNALLGPPTTDGMAQPRGNEEQRRRVWVHFWEAVELQRLLVDNRTEWGVRFTHPMTEALSLRELLAMPGYQQRVVWASGDATLDRVGAVDWSNKLAFSLDVQPYKQIIEKMEREAVEDLCYPRRVSRPGEEDGEDDPERFMVALTELLAVLLLAVSQHAQWKGKVVLYMGDNQVVIRWINSRQSRHPLASFLLQVLAAIEACYGFHLHTAYLRTYHNVVADALTRKDADVVIKEAGLEHLPKPDSALLKFLDRGWQRRALIWAGQADSDAAQACRLAESRNPSQFPKPLFPSRILDVSFLNFGEASESYVAALQASGARLVDGAGKDLRHVSCPGQPLLACLTLMSKSGKEQSFPIELINEADLWWIDCRDKAAIEDLKPEIAKKGFEVKVRPICGRSLKDQVWWKRWVLVATRWGERPFDWVTSDHEPCTPPLAGYPLEWLEDEGQLPLECWEPGVLKVDSSMPYLGATKPKPSGTLQRPKEGRALVWDPKRPLPGLHDGSSDPRRKDRLLLLGKGPDGPAARVIQPQEVCKLVEGSTFHEGLVADDRVRKALLAAPRVLCDLATRWAAAQVEQKVGVCKLHWEEESRKVLEQWLEKNPPNLSFSMVGGRGKKKNKDLPINEQAMKSMSYVLRHAAGTPECPISEEGWVKWDDLSSHESCRRYGGWTLWDAIEADAKDRVVATPDADGVWWVAAWSGHTQERVVGPAAIVPPNELPNVLVHGSYRRHTASIQKKGLLRKSRDLHFHDPESRTGKWRLDLETCVKVNVKAASDAGCVFRKTGNDVWLCDRNVPPGAILSITEWDKPRDVPPSGMLFELRKREEAKGARKGESASSAASGSDFNPAALDIPAYRPWQPKSKPNLVTEEVASAAFELGSNLPDDVQGGIEVDPSTQAVRSRRLAACIAPGDPEEGDECDWSPDDSDVEVVMSTPAASTTKPKEEEEGSDVSMEEEGAETREEEAAAELTVNPKSESMDVPMEETGASSSTKGVESLEPKAEEILEGETPQVRRRKMRFGSAHLHLLKAVADADAKNWESLQTALNSATGTAQAKSELVERLEHLADLRVKSMVAAEKSAQEHAQRAKHYTEAETQLKQDIAAGVPIWVARRAHRARERAARNRQGEPRTTSDNSQPSNLTEVSPEEGGQILDDAFAASAKANLAEFKQVLKKEAQEEKVERKRKPDSARRKKIKKDRKKERKANSKDDAERDRNHAIAHQPQGSVASFSPGPLGVVTAMFTQGAQGAMVWVEESELDSINSGVGLAQSQDVQRIEEDGMLPFDVFSGVLFDLGAVVLVLLLGWLLQSFGWYLWRKFSSPRRSSEAKLKSPLETRKARERYVVAAAERVGSEAAQAPLREVSGSWDRGCSSCHDRPG